MNQAYPPDVYSIKNQAVPVVGSSSKIADGQGTDHGRDMRERVGFTLFILPPCFTTLSPKLFSTGARGYLHSAPTALLSTLS